MNEINFKELFGEIPNYKKRLAEVIIILLQAYRDDNGLLETELKYLKTIIDESLEKLKKENKIKTFLG